MVPEAAITEWAAIAPWPQRWMIEQDLIICRTLVTMFQNDSLRAGLAFRGGTALHKIFFHPARRYSEDIDLVQVEGGPIGPILDAFRAQLEPLLGKAKRKQGPGMVTLAYKMRSESATAPLLRLKIEINSREHFALFGIQRHPFSVTSQWFTGAADIPTFTLEELLGTKLRALYQRRKGRDLFDLWLGLRTATIDPVKIVRVFKHRLSLAGQRISRAEFELNLAEKLAHPGFAADLELVGARLEDWSPAEAAELVRRTLLAELERLP